MSHFHPLLAISPVDGRYRNQTAELAPFFSEYALIRYRVLVEWLYLKWLLGLPLNKGLEAYVSKIPDPLEQFEKFQLSDAERVKALERQTNHDVKAVEYLVKDHLRDLGLGELREWVHFGLTSQDINNVAIPLALKNFSEKYLYPALENLIRSLENKAEQWEPYVMLARTHGQPASPTRLGKEIRVFSVRLSRQLTLLKQVPFTAKFGGATGNFNAHYAAFPHLDWHKLADAFIAGLGLERSFPTTQIDHYDMLAAWCQGLTRLLTILIDLCQDVWLYISLNYFSQATRTGEVGSSAMPHKVNPIDFENAEGNLGVARVLLEHLALKLPISRLQRDLTDSTVLRNIGVPIAHAWVALQSILKGLEKLQVNAEALKADLEAHPEVLAEAIQTILRREGFPDAYEQLRDYTRGKVITIDSLHYFVESLPVSDAVKSEIKSITPSVYCGK
jgi:adenylosuccinate lyase